MGSVCMKPVGMRADLLYADLPFGPFGKMLAPTDKFGLLIVFKSQSSRVKMGPQQPDWIWEPQRSVESFGKSDALMPVRRPWGSTRWLSPPHAMRLCQFCFSCIKHWESAIGIQQASLSRHILQFCHWFNSVNNWAVKLQVLSVIWKLAKNWIEIEDLGDLELKPIKTQCVKCHVVISNIALHHKHHIQIRRFVCRRCWSCLWIDAYKMYVSG